ncbi:hypothetical protein ACWF9B_00335 [Streptomyces sp. NPDC055089]
MMQRPYKSRPYATSSVRPYATSLRPYAVRPDGDVPSARPLTHS